MNKKMPSINFLIIFWSLIFSVHCSGQKNELERLKTLAAELISEQEAMGLELYIATSQEVLLHEVWGYSNQAQDQKLRKNSVYNIRSMTKPMVGAVLHRFIESGLVRLDDKISDHLDFFESEKVRDITIEELLLHRAGYTQGQPGRSWTRLSGLSEMVHYWAEQGPTVSKDVWSYADAHSDIIGYLLEQLSGKSLATLYQEELIEPLSMNRTFADWENKTILSDINPLYRGSTKDWSIFWRPEDGPYYSFAMGAQSVYSTVKDYEKFIRLYFNEGKHKSKQLLTPEAINLTFSNRLEIQVPPGIFPLADGRNLYYGHFWGMAYDKDQLDDDLPFVFLHQGTDGTSAYGFPALDLVVIVMTQSRGTGVLPKIEKEVVNLVNKMSQ